MRASRFLNNRYTQGYCIMTHYHAIYTQQHPTRLCKQLYPQTVGLLFCALLKNIIITVSCFSLVLFKKAK